RGTFTSGFVLALWEKYLRTLLADLDGRRAVFISYAELLARPAAQCARLLHGLRELGVGGLHEASETELSAFLDPRLRRSAPRAHVRLSPKQNSLQQWLEAQCAAQGVVAVSGVPQAAAPDAELAEYEASFKYHINRGGFLFGAGTSERLQ